MPAFTPTRTLLNPQFEGYKLSFSPSPRLQHIPLQQRATQSRTGINARGFQDVASRVRHNHLAVGSNKAMYVSEDGSVVLVSLDKDELDISNEQDGVSQRVVFQLPEYVSSSGTDVHAEYPAAAYLSHDTWLVSDGHGMAYLIRTPDDTSPAQVLASWGLLVDNAIVPSPFQLHSASVVAPHLAIAVLSSPAPSTANPSSSNIKERPMYDIWAVRVPMSVSNSPQIPFEVAWRRRGTYIPLFVTYVPVRDAFLLIGGSSYHDIASQPVQPYDPASDELVPVPRNGENGDTSHTSPPPPYSWTQTDDSVTIAFAIPGATPKTSIHATFERSMLSLRAGYPPLSQPFYTGAPLWDAIHPNTSLWTWERGNTTTSAGLLTLHLDKAHSGTRWSHVFAHGFEVHEVTETLDPSEVVNIRETLDKYTAALQENATELGHGVPSLAEGERDNEVDSSVGHMVLLTWVASGGTTSGPVDDSPAVILSLPMPGVAQDAPLSLVVKNDIDGPMFTLDSVTGWEWKHTATYPALGFVLASKRDTRFTFHVSSDAVFAFESGARNNGGGNVYIYRGSKPGNKSAKQGVFQQQTDTGTLLGVGALMSQEGQLVLLCLSESELTICRDLF